MTYRVSDKEFESLEAARQVASVTGSKIQRFKHWYCPKCHHEVYSAAKPEAMRWSDGHACYFIEGEPVGSPSIK